MSSENDVRNISVPASADLSAAQYLMMDIDSNGRLATVATKGAKMAGVLQDKPAALGRVGALGYSGVTKVVFGADSVAPGDEIISDAAGKAIATDAADQYVLGVCLEGGDTDEIGKVLIKPYMRSA